MLQMFIINGKSVDIPLPLKSYNIVACGVTKNQTIIISTGKGIVFIASIHVLKAISMLIVVI